MMIRKADFKGQIPRLNARLLPGNYAQIATNTRLEDGTIGPVKAPVVAHDFGGHPGTFLKFNGQFISFTATNVKATTGPVAQDRLYYTGDGAPKMRIGATDYPLALYAPTVAPVVSKTSATVGGAPTLTAVYNNDPAEGEESRVFNYRYSAVTSKGETIASPSFKTQRIDGEYVTLSDLSLPPDTQSIRVYRLDVTGTTGVFGFLFEVAYDANIHGPLNDASVNDFFVDFPDLSSAPKETGDDAALEEVVVYVYTYVTEFDEESAPSPASDLVKVGPTDTTTYAAPSPSQVGRGIDRIRIYRSKTSLTGVTDFYFLKEIPVSNPAVDQTDDFEAPLNEPLPSVTNDPPPDTMQGLIALPNGLMAAHSGRELLFCEPYKPHAWPVAYRLTTDTDIVGLGAFGTFVVVLTKGAPYMVQGSEPNLMIMEKLEENLPCLTSLSIVDLGYSIAYASTEGLVVVDTGGAHVISRDLFTDEQWRAMRPESFRAAQRTKRYHFSYQPVALGPRRFGIIDLTRQQPYYMEADIEVERIYFDKEQGNLFYTGSTGTVRQFDPRGGAVVAKQIWRGKRTVLKGHDNFGAILIETDDVPGQKETPADPDCTTRVYADGKLIHTLTDTNVAARLPAGFLANRWEVEIEGYAPVTGISLATDIVEFAEG